MKPNLFPFIGEKWAGVPQPTTRFDGKTIIVTGANAGLGFEAAVKFVTLGAAKVILGVRNMAKGAVAARRIEDRTQCKHVVEVWELDMSLYSSVNQFVARVDNELAQLDIVILNAGATHNEYTISPEGWEYTLQVNVMSTVLLALLLLPKLKASKTSEQDVSHLVIVTSESQRWLDMSDIPDTEAYGGNILQALNAKPTNTKAWDGLQQNATSKLFAMYATQAIARLTTRPNGEVDVIVTATCPGACRSDIMRPFKESGIITAIGLYLFDLLFSKPTEAGGSVYVSAAALGYEGHGGWYKTTALASPGNLVTSEEGKEIQQRVWNEIVESLRANVPAVRQII